MALPEYPGVSVDRTDVPQWLTAVATLANRLLLGRQNIVGEVTLTPDVASTEVKDARAHYGSVVLFDPMTANAASELAAGGMYVTEANRDNTSFTITHANAASADRTFRYVIVG